MRELLFSTSKKSSETEIENVNVMFDSGFFLSVKWSVLEIITESLSRHIANMCYLI
jgi:hypothetical protein